MGKWLRRVALALLCSLLAGFAFGTCLRHEAERPIQYIGRAERGARGRAVSADMWTAVRPPSTWPGVHNVAGEERPRRSPGLRAAATLPLDVRDAGAAVLDAGHDEEQVGEAVQVAERHGR